jgi:hypothetical protein
MAGLLAHLLIQQADGALLLAWFGNLAIIVWKHRRELRQRPRLKPLFSGQPRV